MKLKIVIYGIGSFAEYVSYVLSHDSEYNVVAFCVEKEFKREFQNHENLPVINFENLEEHFPPNEYHLFIAVGNNWVRERILKASKIKGYSFISYVSSKAITWKDLEYGENVFISEDSALQPFVFIGNNSFILAKIGSKNRGQTTFLNIPFSGK